MKKIIGNTIYPSAAPVDIKETDPTVPSWAKQENPPETQVDQVYRPTSDNAQSGKAVAEALNSLNVDVSTKIESLTFKTYDELINYEFKENQFYIINFTNNFSTYGLSITGTWLCLYRGESYHPMGNRSKGLDCWCLHDDRHRQYAYGYSSDEFPYGYVIKCLPDTEGLREQIGIPQNYDIYSFNELWDFVYNYEYGGPIFSVYISEDLYDKDSNRLDCGDYVCIRLNGYVQIIGSNSELYTLSIHEYINEEPVYSLTKNSKNDEVIYIASLDEFYTKVVNKNIGITRVYLENSLEYGDNQYLDSEHYLCLNIGGVITLIDSRYNYIYTIRLWVDEDNNYVYNIDYKTTSFTIPYFDIYSFDELFNQIENKYELSNVYINGTFIDENDVELPNGLYTCTQLWGNLYLQGLRNNKSYEISKSYCEDEETGESWYEYFVGLPENGIVPEFYIEDLDNLRTQILYNYEDKLCDVYIANDLVDTNGTLLPCDNYFVKTVSDTKLFTNFDNITYRVFCNSVTDEVGEQYWDYTFIKLLSEPNIPNFEVWSLEDLFNMVQNKHELSKVNITSCVDNNGTEILDGLYLCINYWNSLYLQGLTNNICYEILRSGYIDDETEETIYEYFAHTPQSDVASLQIPHFYISSFDDLYDLVWDKHQFCTVFIHNDLVADDGEFNILPCGYYTCTRIEEELFLQSFDSGKSYRFAGNKYVNEETGETESYYMLTTPPADVLPFVRIPDNNTLMTIFNNDIYCYGRVFNACVDTDMEDYYSNILPFGDYIVRVHNGDFIFTGERNNAYVVSQISAIVDEETNRREDVLKVERVINDAFSISISDPGGYFEGETVEDALEELASKFDGLEALLASI